MGPILKKLLIFPGDWHLLKKFQPVLMKAYFHAGLKKIAQSSGYKAVTLKSLENCPHFKRTHSFLLQVLEGMFTDMISADLRVASLKGMAPLFAAYDRPCYQKLIPNHLADIECYDDQILQCFRAGGFTAKVKGGLGHAIALDEAHEMCINCDLKIAVVRHDPTY